MNAITARCSWPKCLVIVHFFVFQDDVLHANFIALVIMILNVFETCWTRVMALISLRLNFCHI